MTRLTPIQLLLYNLDPRTAPKGLAYIAPDVAHQQLKDLTVQDFGDDVKAWRRWLRAHRDLLPAAFRGPL
jgi:hypothetical protein